MKIETSQYDIADLAGNTKAIDAIKQAEQEIAKATGTTITLIAYKPAGSQIDDESEHVFEV